MLEDVLVYMYVFASTNYHHSYMCLVKLPCWSASILGGMYWKGVGWGAGVVIGQLTH
jgi:hypothetical protein